MAYYQLSSPPQVCYFYPQYPNLQVVDVANCEYGCCSVGQVAQSVNQACCLSSFQSFVQNYLIGIIVVISVIAFLLIVVIALLLVYFLWYRKRRGCQQHKTDDDDDQKAVTMSSRKDFEKTNSAENKKQQRPTSSRFALDSKLNAIKEEDVIVEETTTTIMNEKTEDPEDHHHHPHHHHHQDDEEEEPVIFTIQNQNGTYTNYSYVDIDILSNKTTSDDNSNISDQNNEPITNYSTVSI